MSHASPLTVPDPERPVLVIGAAPRGTFEDGLGRTLAESGTALRYLQAATDIDALQAASVGDEAPPSAVVLAPDLDNPLALARRAHQHSPLTQIVILARPERFEELRKATTMAPMIGEHWSLVDPADERLPELVRVAVQGTLQRMHLRATLDRMNARMLEPVAFDSEAHRSLVVSNQYLASIVEHAQDAILAVDHDDTIATWNQGASHMFAYERQAALGQPVGILVSDAHEGTFIELVQAARSGQAVRNREFACRRSDGTAFHAEFTLAPVRDEADRSTTVAVTARDITQRKRHEAELVALHRTLEQRVQDLHRANASLLAALDELAAKERELVALNATLEVQATTDALTGLKNRMVFHNSLEEMIAVAERQRAPLAVLVVDVDHFKRVNDTLGHQQGDRVLQTIARTLMAHTREQDVVARYGGEEFVALLPNTGLEDASLVAENLRRACGGLGTGEPPLTVSIGVASFVLGDSAASLLGRADEALYASKAHGRNRVTAASGIDADRPER